MCLRLGMPIDIIIMCLRLGMPIDIIIMCLRLGMPIDLLPSGTPPIFLRNSPRLETAITLNRKPALKTLRTRANPSV